MATQAVIVLPGAVNVAPFLRLRAPAKNVHLLEVDRANPALIGCPEEALVTHNLLKPFVPLAADPDADLSINIGDTVVPLSQGGTCIAAPTGSGKTTLLEGWHEQLHADGVPSRSVLIAERGSALPGNVDDYCFVLNHLFWEAASGVIRAASIDSLTGLASLPGAAASGGISQGLSPAFAAITAGALHSGLVLVFTFGTLLTRDQRGLLRMVAQAAANRGTGGVEASGSSRKGTLTVVSGAAGLHPRTFFSDPAVSDDDSPGFWPGAELF